MPDTETNAAVRTPAAKTAHRNTEFGIPGKRYIAAPNKIEADLCIPRYTSDERRETPRLGPSLSGRSARLEESETKVIDTGSVASLVSDVECK
jgi:hypothetical protein